MKRMVVLLAAGLLAGTAAWAQFPGIPGIDKAIKAAEAQKPWTAEEEKVIGQATAAKLVAVFGIYEQPRAVKYLNLVGRAVSQPASRQDLDYHFGILDTEMVNAFACPGGYVFVTRGLLANLEDEAELAGVLGHEIVHTGERHVEKELRSKKMAALGVETGLEQAQRVDTPAGIPLAELTKLADRISNQLLAGKLSRDKENEADSRGLELAAATGYDPRAYAELLGALDEASKEAGNRRALGNLTASHPKFSDRVKRLQEIIAKRGWDKEERPRLAERYRASVVLGGAEEAPAVASATTASGKPAPGAGPGKPAGAATRKGGPAGWDFGFRPFAADMITTQGKQRQKVRMYFSEQAYRMEGEEKGQKTIAIMRLDRKVMWSLMPAQKMYAEIAFNLPQNVSQVAQDPEAKVEREQLGTEPVGPYQCVKYRVRVTHKGNVFSGLQWAAPELDGFVVKTFDEKTKSTVEYENIQLGPQAPSLFEVPPGYRKLSY